jgi:hypothetical protein
MAAYWRQVAYERLAQAAYEVGSAVPGHVGQGMVDESRQILDAAEQLRNVLKNGLTPEEQAQQALGRKWIKLFAQGIDSEIPGAREATFRLGVEGLQALSAGTIGSDEAKRISRIAAGLYRDGWTDSQILVALAAQGVGETALRNLATVMGWNQAGVNDALDYVAGMSSKDGTASDAGDDLGSAALSGANSQNWQQGGDSSAGSWVSGFGQHIRSVDWTSKIRSWGLNDYWHGQSPPPKGPLHEIDKWGAGVADAWLGGFGKRMAHVGRYMPTAQLQALLGGGHTSLEVRHVVSLDLRNAPPGVTNEAVADMVRPVLDWDAQWQAKMADAMAATGTRWVESR